jgi:hypothetical protein
MKRKDFLFGSLAAVVASLIPWGRGNANITNSDTPLEKQVGFNHIPKTKNTKQMKTVYHKANTRGKANHGWLNSNHTFSFANYYDPSRMNFGVLRVLNDDIITGGSGFGTHPHQNMEIISIPLDGAIAHKDDIGNSSEIKSGEIQVMSAGTGVQHSEFNASKENAANFLQIWVIPNKKQVTPRYDQQAIDKEKSKDNFLQILSPSADDDGVWIHQNAYFSMGEFTKPTSKNYKLNHSTNGVYVFVIEGAAIVNNENLSKRDGLGIWDTDSFDIKIEAGSKILLMEVPMA